MFRFVQCIPTPDRTNGHSGRPLRLYSKFKVGDIRTHEHMHKTQHSTHADMSRVTFSFVRWAAGEGIIALLQAEGLVHLPSVFYSGCQNGGGGNRAGHTLVKNVGQTGSTATPESLKWNLFLRWKVGRWWKESLLSGDRNEEWFDFLWREPVESLYNSGRFFRPFIYPSDKAEQRF